jgi:RsiW-degrading membrane proteinase PrsW (M82 family)
MSLLTILLYAFLGGLIPSIIWLGFWLQEDRLHPEPKKIILHSFLAGMVAVLIVLPFERFINCAFGSVGSDCNIIKDGYVFVVIVLLGLVEEIAKYWAALWSCLHSKYNDEPIDAVIYMISSALGFAALENAFFLLQPLLAHDPVSTVITSDLRFLGANLLHVISSATIGIFIAFAFYKKKWQKKIYLLIGIVFAVFLHAFFNFSIINDNGRNLLLVFGVVWLGIIVLILFFEKIKNIKNTNLKN